MNTWVEDHVVEFSLKDERQVPNDDSNDLDNSKFIATAGTSQSGEDVSNLFDNDETTIWHSKWSGDGTSREDTYIQLDFNEPTKVNGLRYLPRQSGTNGNIKDYKILTNKNNGATWEKVSTGTLKTNSSWKVLPIPEEVITNLKLVIVTNSGSGIYGSGAELRVFSTRTDVTSLELLLEKVNNQDISNLNETSIKTVIDIKEKLTEAISNENILAAEVVELVEDVNKQLAILEIIKLDYTKLEEYIAETEALDLTLYTRDSV